jgi:hypothetical protein
VPRGRPTVRVEGSTRPQLSGSRLLFLALIADNGREGHTLSVRSGGSEWLTRHLVGVRTGSLPDEPSLEWLRKEARRRLEEVRRADPAARLADAQFAVAQEYGFSSWRALKAHVDSLTTDGRLIDAPRSGDVHWDAVVTPCTWPPRRAIGRLSSPTEGRCRPGDPRQQARRRRQGQGGPWEATAFRRGGPGHRDHRGARVLCYSTSSTERT